MRTALIFLFFSSVSFAQNLVTNPGFELYKECPSGIGQINKATGWFSANTGTPEYARMRCPFAALNPHSGEGMAGLILHAQYPKAIEYISTTLSTTLIRDSHYCIGFHIRAEESLFYIDKVGLALTHERPYLHEWAPLALTPILISPAGEPIHRALGWQRISKRIKASGGEQWLTIGNFNRPENLTQYMNEFAWGVEPGWNSYYFVDDVFVIPTASDQECMEEKEKSRNSLYQNPVLIHEKPNSDTHRLVLYFGFDSDKLEPNEELRLMDLLKTSCGQFQINGHTDGRGDETYNFFLSQRRVGSVKKIIELHLETGRQIIKSDYFGKLKPVADNGTEEGRAHNRRVEVLCLPILH